MRGDSGQNLEKWLESEPYFMNSTVWPVSRTAQHARERANHLSKVLISSACSTRQRIYVNAKLWCRSRGFFTRAKRRRQTVGTRVTAVAHIHHNTSPRTLYFWFSEVSFACFSVLKLLKSNASPNTSYLRRKCLLHAWLFSRPWGKQCLAQNMQSTCRTEL